MNRIEKTMDNREEVQGIFKSEERAAQRMKWKSGWSIYIHPGYGCMDMSGGREQWKFSTKLRLGRE